jgi:hypothetical protein
LSRYDDLDKKVEERIAKLIETEHAREQKLEMIQELAEADLESAELNERRKALFKEKRRQRNGRSIKPKRVR